MMMSGVWSCNDAKGGMRFAFPPYGLRPTGYPDLAAPPSLSQDFTQKCTCWVGLPKRAIGQVSYPPLTHSIRNLLEKNHVKK
jgi:hypothetical protein